MSGTVYLGTAKDNNGNTHHLGMLISCNERWVYLCDEEGKEIDETMPENCRPNLCAWEEDFDSPVHDIFTNWLLDAADALEEKIKRGR